jgi:hypothetical protein|tara:strand:- start:986 stop:1579 length:594 start_codon:yes stop_codon:yes gene_type:complete
MGRNPEGMIKKAISETIVEEMFRDFGFYVLKFGQENTINPLTQLENFVKKCDGKFRLVRDGDWIEEITFLKKMPDFVIIDKDGNVLFLEVKFSRNAQLDEQKSKVWHIYPHTIVLVVNLEVGDSLVYSPEPQGEISQKLKDSRFHIWTNVEDVEKGEFTTNTIPLSEWVEHTFEINFEEIIKGYEDLVVKWLNKTKI